MADVLLNPKPLLDETDRYYKGWRETVAPTSDTEALVAALQTASIQGYAADPEGKLFLQAAAEIKRLQGAEIDAGLAIAQFNRNELALRAEIKRLQEEVDAAKTGSGPV